MTLVFEHVQIKPAPKLVALVLADHANGDGICWPSYRRISEYTGMDERTIQRHVKYLIEIGVITKLRTGHVTKQGDKLVRVSNAYQFNDYPFQKLSTTRLLITAEIDYLGVDKNTQSRVGGLSTKSSKKHKLNHQLLTPVEKSAAYRQAKREPTGLGDIFDQVLGAPRD